MPSASPLLRFHAQHADLYRLIDQIETLLRTSATASPAEAIRAAFHQLSAKLRLHLALEDDALYPRLIREGDASLTRLAQQFQQEMSGLRDAYEAFLSQWLHTGAFSRDPQGFATAVETLFAPLKNRLRREDAQLYPLADRAYSAETIRP